MEANPWLFKQIRCPFRSMIRERSVLATLVTLDVLLAEHRKGASPEAIAEELDTLDLADIYAAIAYCLRHGDEVAAYLQRRQHQADMMRKKVEDAGMTSPDLPGAIQKRWSEKENGPLASSSQ
jgi:hypothetical protein